MSSETKIPVQWGSFFLCVVISFGQFIGAYESVIIGTTLQKPDFMRTMGLWDADGNEMPNYGSIVGAITGLFAVSPLSLNVGPPSYHHQVLTII